MAQTIKHRRGKLESIASITPINGELIIASGSDLSVHQEGLLFVGVEGNVLTPSNKILTGSATIDVTGGSFDHSVDGIPYYETDAKKLHILGHGGNTNVVFTTNSLDLDGSGIVSSSTQVSELAGIENSTLTITAGDGLKTGGTFTTNQNSDSAVTLNIDVSDFAGTGLEDDGSENLRIAATGVTNAMLAGSIANGKLANSSISIGGISFSLGDTDATPAFDLADATGYLTSNLSGTITNAQLAGSIANGKLANSAITISGTSVSLGSSISDETLFGGTGVISGSSQVSLGGFDTDDLSEGSTNKYATTANVKSALNANLGTATIGDSNDTITIAGNLTVNGTTTYISSSNLNIGDNILELNYAGTAADAGLLVKDAVSTGTSGSLLWDASEDYWIAGALGAEGRIIVGNGTDTAGKITKFSADGVITDSIISESGTTVTIANNLVLSGLTASQLVVTNGSKQLVSSTDISSLTLTLDGGEF